MERAQQTGSGVADGSPLTDAVTVRQSRRSAVLSLALMLSAGVALGFLSDLIGLSHPKGIVFKVLIALPLSGAGAVLLYRFAFARRHVLLLAGLGASAAMLSMHYFDYRGFPRRLEPRLRDVIEAQVIQQMLVDLSEQTHQLGELVAQLPPERRKEFEQVQAAKLQARGRRADELEVAVHRLAGPEKEKEMEPIFRRFGEELAEVRGRIRAQGTEQMALGDHGKSVEPVVGPWINNLGLWGYLALRADQGVTIDVFGARAHLGHKASYSYWIMEVLIAGVIAGSLMNKMTKE